MAIFYGVVEGDSLDSGGRVIDGAPGFSVEGEDGRHRRMTFLGQHAWCDVCESAGKIVAALGSPDTHRMLDLTSGHRRQALGGDLVLCKCKRHPRIVAVHARSMKIIDDGGGRATGLVAASTTTSAAPRPVSLPSFDDRFVLGDHTGKSVPFVATDTKPKEVRICNHANDAVMIAEYMVSEMKRNPFTPEGKKITQANSFDAVAETEKWNAMPWYTKLGSRPDYFGVAAGLKASAYSIWVQKVAPERDWDHKTSIKRKLKKTFNDGWQKYGLYDYFYDIWSNIHYGYVGIGTGFSESELINGAALAQIADDAYHFKKIQNHSQNRAWLARGDDAQDQISIKLGIDLYSKFKPHELTVAHLLNAIASIPVPWGASGTGAKRNHVCKLRH